MTHHNSVVNLLTCFHMQTPQIYASRVVCSQILRDIKIDDMVFIWYNYSSVIQIEFKYIRQIIAVLPQLLYLELSKDETKPPSVTVSCSSRTKRTVRSWFWWSTLFESICSKRPELVKAGWDNAGFKAKAISLVLWYTTAVHIPCHYRCR